MKKEVLYTVTAATLRERVKGQNKHWQRRERNEGEERERETRGGGRGRDRLRQIDTEGEEGERETSDGGRERKGGRGRRVAEGEP